MRADTLKAANRVLVDPHHRLPLSSVWGDGTASSRAISCSPRKAIYVLDGLLDNNTLLRPREHYTDTHGFTEQLFGLCYLLGFSFMPRLKDLKDQQLYRIERDSSHGVVDGLYRGTVDTPSSASSTMRSFASRPRCATGQPRRTSCLNDLQRARTGWLGR